MTLQTLTIDIISYKTLKNYNCTSVAAHFPSLKITCSLESTVTCSSFWPAAKHHKENRSDQTMHDSILIIWAFLSTNFTVASYTVTLPISLVHLLPLWVFYFLQIAYNPLYWTMQMTEQLSEMENSKVVSNKDYIIYKYLMIQKYPVIKKCNACGRGIERYLRKLSIKPVLGVLLV